MKVKRTTAIIASVALLAASVIGFAIGARDLEPDEYAQLPQPIEPRSASRLRIRLLSRATAAFRSCSRSRCGSGETPQYVVQFADQRPAEVHGQRLGRGRRRRRHSDGREPRDTVESIPLAFGPTSTRTPPPGQAPAERTCRPPSTARTTRTYSVAANYLRRRRLPRRDHPARLGVRRRVVPVVVAGQRSAVGRRAYRHVVESSVGLAELPLRLERHARLPAERDRRVSRATTTSTSSASTSTTRASPSRGTHDEVVVGPRRSVELDTGRTSRSSATSPSRTASRSAIPEWGLTGATSTVTSKVGGDDPTFVNGMRDWMNGLPATGAAASRISPTSTSTRRTATTASTRTTSRRPRCSSGRVRRHRRPEYDHECSTTDHLQGGRTRADRSDDDSGHDARADHFHDIDDINDGARDHDHDDGRADVLVHGDVRGQHSHLRAQSQSDDALRTALRTRLSCSDNCGS